MAIIRTAQQKEDKSIIVLFGQEDLVLLHDSYSRTMKAPRSTLKFCSLHAEKLEETMPKFVKGKVPRRGFREGMREQSWLPEADGLLCGPFGIHKKDNEYLLTHMPSGYIMSHRARLREAKKIVEQLLALPIGWGFRNPDRVRKSIREQILDVCRGV